MSSNRPNTYRGRIKISRGDMHLLESGRKKCTIRMGKASVGSDTLIVSDGRNDVQVKILKVDNSRTFGSLNDQDAYDEGLQTSAELRQDLRQYYPRVRDEDPVTIIYFEPSTSELKLF